LRPAPCTSELDYTEQYRWSAWAAPKGKDGKIDHNAALTCDDLIAFVNGKLFPYLPGSRPRLLRRTG